MQYKELLIGHTINGQKVNIPIYEFKSSRPGPKVYIQSGVHGAEIQGHLVIEKLIEWLKNNDFHGTWTLVPFANPFSVSNYQGEFTQGRFDPISGHNWNRDYHLLTTKDKETDFAINIETFCQQRANLAIDDLKSEFNKALHEKLIAKEKHHSLYGQRLGQTLTLKLQKLFFDADIVIDLHTAHHSDRYLYAPSFTENEASFFNFPFILFIPHHFATACDEAAFVPRFELNQYLKSQNSPPLPYVSAFTLELGNQETIDSSKALQDRDGILNYLYFKKAHPNALSLKNHKSIKGTLENFKLYHTLYSGLVEFIANPGDILEKGDLLYKQLIKTGQDFTWRDFIANEKCYIVSKANSSNARMGSQIYQVIENFK